VRYWAPTIADVARVADSEMSSGWTVSITPMVERACPLALTLRMNRLLDLALAGETYTNRTIASLDYVLPLCEAVTEGRVIQRRWISVATGADCAIETIVALADGTVWHDGRTIDAVAAAVSPELIERRDRHFLPYRR
jgi:hypothetical protein